MTMPKYGFGVQLRAPCGFVGRVDAIFKNLDAAVMSRVIDRTWWQEQEFPPSTALQIFYCVVGDGGLGAVVVGEDECELIEA